MKLSLTPFFLAIELGFVFVLAWRSGRQSPDRGSMLPVYAYLLLLAVYGVVTSVLGARGLFVSEQVLALLPGLWLQGVVVVLAVVPIVLFSGLRQRMRQIVDDTPWHWFALFHAMRIGALGTAVKTLKGEFPVPFELGVGVPDFLFGLSALWIAWKAKRGELGRKQFMVWNAIGVLVIVPGALILLQLHLPGSLQAFTSLPDARVLFTYPMSIAPLVGVPLFILINAWVAWRLWERGKEPEPV